MKTILIINPPVYDFKLYDEWMNPQGLLYIASILKQAGFQVIFKDYLHYRTKSKRYQTGFFYREAVQKPRILEPILKKYYRFGLPVSEIKTELKQINYDLALLGSFLTYWYPGVWEMAELLKEIYPTRPVWSGGIYNQLCSEHAAQMKVDRSINGAFTSQILNEIADLTGHRLTTPADKFCEKLDLQSVAYKPYFSMTMNLGCMLRCRYCASSVLQPEFKPLTLPDLKILREGYNRGVRNFAFFDDALLYRFEQLEQFVDELEKNGMFFDFHLPNGIHISQLDSKKSIYLAKHRFKTLRFGFEGLSERMQIDSMQKATQDKVEQGISFLKEAGFSKKNIGFYLLLSPFTTQENIEQSRDFLKRLGVNIHLNLYSPIPKTPDFNQLKLKYPEIEAEPLLQNDSVFTSYYQIFSENWIETFKKGIQVYNSSF